MSDEEQIPVVDGTRVERRSEDGAFVLIDEDTGREIRRVEAPQRVAKIR